MPDQISIAPEFPRFLPPHVLRVLDLQRQLRSLEKLPVAEQRARQGKQFASLIAHAEQHSPFWSRRIKEARAAGRDGALRLANFPPLTRAELQERFDEMRARPNDGRRFLVATTSSSGSTGRPVRVEKFADIHNPLYVATSLIDHAWHRRDLNAEVAVITDVRDGSQLGWGPRLAAFGLKGKAHMRNMIRHPPEHLLEWLAGLRPTYLITTPSMAKRLAEVALAGNRSVGPIRQVITYAEVVSDECRTLCRAAFGAQVTDRYSCEEIGWIALQCPKHEHYHVMSGTVVCEIVDDAGAPCRPGETGRVLLTSLHSYGMPVIRYDIGDVAERGSPCDCGINLPVIKRILGRERSFIRLPDGSTRLARLTGEYWRQIAPVKEYRVVQYADGLIEAFVVCERALTEAERQAMVQMLQKVFEHPFEVIITETEMIDWGSRTKRLDILRLNRNRDGSLPAQAMR